MKDKRARKLLKKGRPIRQVAVLPHRISDTGALEILLITSRQTRRFVLPKGWPMKGRPDWQAAALEAEQEAGLVGDVATVPIGTYDYWKRLSSIMVHVSVTVYAFRVTARLFAWPERHSRRSKWLSRDEATMLVDEPKLASLIAGFEPASEAKSPEH